MSDAHGAEGVDRREFFARTLVGAAAITLPLTALGAERVEQNGEVGVVDTRFPIGDVRRYGARGDGKADDTIAFNNAIRSMAGLGGGEVTVPPGTFMIDPDHQHGKSIRLMSKVSLRGAGTGATVLQAIAGSSSSYAVVFVEHADHVALYHFTARGERAAHAGTTGEQGHCILLLTAAHVAVQGVLATDAWGDGFVVGQSGSGPGKESTDVHIAHCFAENNRRCGFSVTAGRRVSITDCVGAGTNGTAPECGIDVEPDGGASPCADVIVSNCQFYGNHGFGMIQGGNGDNHAVRTAFSGNVLSDNSGGGIHVGAGVTGGIVVQNIVTCANAQQVGILQDFGPAVIISDNVIAGPSSYGIFVRGNQKPEQTGTSRIANNRVSGATVAGICAYNNAGRLALIGNEITACTIGLSLVGVANFSISGNTIFANATFGAHVARGRRGTVSGNVFEANLGTGLFLEQCDAITATGNALHENAEHGMLMQASSNCSVTGNVAGENSQKQDERFHNVWVTDGSDGNVVSCNVAYQGSATPKPHFGIRVDSGSNNLVQSNLAQDGANGISVVVHKKP